MMQQSIFLLFAVAAIDTLANPGNGYPYAAPHPEFAKRALMKRDVNNVNAANQVQQAEYHAYVNTPDGLDEASEAHQAQFAQLKAQAEAKAQQAQQYAADWQAQSTKAKAGCKNSIFGICIDDLQKLKDAAAAAAPAPPAPASAPDSAPASAPAPPPPPAPASAPAPPPPPAPAPAPATSDNNVTWVYWYPYGYYGYYGGYWYPYRPYYGGGSYPVAVPTGYPQPGKGKTSCSDVNNQGYICNDAYNELDYCFKGFPYYFGFAAGSGGGNGQVTVAKCCFYGTCAASDDGTVGLCYCQASSDSSSSSSSSSSS
ncbi:hypothetical protein AC578_9670 [Pseudocercospora eumusae]|uniref:Uncharacterized protein n=1 Tax=Pseudocercospora eumusae TaxID=321146 RepID=A0A139HQJ1_9PEZI|nr:hypothetical protein AC578_9670 [Pseudocercospora eumusae]